MSSKKNSIKIFSNKILKTKWYVQKFNGYPIFVDTVAVLSGSDLPWGLFYKHFFYTAENRVTKFYYDTNDLERIGKIFWNKVKTEKDLEFIINGHKKSYEKAVTQSRYNLKKLDELSVDELKTLLKLQIKCLTLSVGSGHVIESASYVAEQRLKKLHGGNLPEIHPSCPSFFKKAENYAKKLFNQHQDEQIILEKFKEKYGWIQNSYLGEHHISIKDVKTLISKKEKKYKVKHLDKKSKIIARLFSWHDERKASILQAIPKVERVLSVLAKKVGVPLENTKFMIAEEVDKIDTPIFQKELEKRRDFFVNYSPKKGAKILYSGKSARDCIKEIEIKQNSFQREIKGTTACPGIVSGKVRVCLSREKIKSFKKGEILVASMTRPEFMGAMRQASGFVTDEGGITCHAAIIAREMGKPCVIGTRNATKILKDGDLVQVDAVHGVVRILETNKK